MFLRIDRNHLDQLVSLVEDAEISSSNNIFRSLSESSLSLCINIVSTDGFDINLFHLPKNTTLPPRVHAEGTVLIYKELYGSCVVRSTIKSRDISADDLCRGLIVS